MRFIKNVFLSLAILAFTWAVVGIISTNEAYALTCTSEASGDWSVTATWDAGCNGDTVPTAADDVIIATGHAVTLSADVTAASLTFNDAVAAANSLTLNGNDLIVTGATTYTATTGAAGSSIVVGTGTFTTDTLVINDGAATGDMVLSVSTGTITVTGDVSGTWTNAADVQFTSTGDSDMIFGGHFPSGATLDGTGGTITFNSADAQNVGAYTTYNNVVKSGAGTATLLGATTIGGNLTLSAGTLATNTQTFIVTGTTSVTGTITFSTGAKTFTGDVTLNSGGVWTETGASTYTITGNWTNNATTFTASTGLHTFNGASTKTIGGTTATVIPSVTIVTGNHTVSSGSTLTVATVLTVTGVTLTNNGTITATASLTGTGGLTNGATGILNIGDAIDITTLDATDNANTINYTKAGAQTVLDGTNSEYGNLGLSGSGEKTITGGTLIGGNLTVGGTATVNLTGDLNTALRVILGGIIKIAGSWGSTTSNATNQTDTYFTTGTGMVTATVGAGGSSGGGITITSGGSDADADDDADEEDEEADEEEAEETETPEATGGCSGGNKYNTQTGALCISAVVQVAIAGCANRTTGFSTTTGNSCVGNVVSEAATTGTYNFGTVTLKIGSSGSAVMDLQKFLNANSNAGLMADGKFGPKTSAAVKAWQASKGLTADGLFGSMSRAKATK